MGSSVDRVKNFCGLSALRRFKKMLEWDQTLARVGVVPKFELSSIFGVSWRGSKTFLILLRSFFN